MGILWSLRLWRGHVGGLFAVLDAALGQYLPQHPLQDGAFDRLRNEFRKSLATEHFPRAADGIGRQRDGRQILIRAAVELPDFFQRLHAVQPRHHVVQEDDVVGDAAALCDGLSPAQAGIHLDSVAAQDAFGYHQAHFLVVHRQRPDAYAGKRLPARRLGLRESTLPDLPV